VGYGGRDEDLRLGGLRKPPERQEGLLATKPLSNCGRNSVRHEICQACPLLVQYQAMNKKQTHWGKAKETTAGEAAASVVQGYKYVRLRGTLLQARHSAGTERARAGNRQLFYDQ
jgi:hypothetical protein